MRNTVVCIGMLVFLAVGSVTDVWAEDKPVILLDTSGTGGATYAWNGGTVQMAKYFRADGFELRQANLFNLTDADLEGVDILILLGPAVMNVQKKEAVIRFIQGGGGVLVGVYPGYGDASNINSLISNFGLTFDEYWGGVPVYATLVPNSPLVKPNSVGEVGTKEPNHFTVGFPAGQGEGVAVEQNGKFWVSLSKSANLGKGRLLAIGYDYLMTDGRFRDYPGNINFARNMMQYLVGEAADLAVTNVRAKGRGHMAGDTMTVVIKGKNLSQQASDPAEVSVTLVDIDAASGGPGELIKVLGKEPLGSQNGQQNFKIKKAVKIPSFVGPGEYYLLVVIDPDQKTADANRANNTTVSKKIIIQ